jgi:hypothetical protein
MHINSSPENNHGNSALPQGLVELHELGFINTNLNFNIGAFDPIDGIRRYDLVRPDSAERVLWTPDVDDSAMSGAEIMTPKDIHPLFPRPSAYDEIVEGRVWSIPQDAVPYFRMEQNPPYVPSYMSLLGSRVGRLVTRCLMAGININQRDIVVTPNGDDEEGVHLFIIPPLKNQEK